MSQLPDDLIPPDVPVRDNIGRVYCNRKCAEKHGVLARDMTIITYKQRHLYLNNKTHVPAYVGICEECGTII